MAKTAKNKMKYWRRMANKVTIQVPREVKRLDVDGNEVIESYEEDVVLTGRQLRDYVVQAGPFKAPTGLLKDLMLNAGLVNINDVIVPEGETV